MDTPEAVVVVKDPQQPRPNVTPKSATFGSPIATQDSWTAPPRRRQVQQKAKASWLADDDDDDDKQNQQNGNHAMRNPRQQFNNDPDLDGVSYEFDSSHNGKTADGWDVYNQSPTPHASQTSRLPSQSVPRSTMSGSSDLFNIYEPVDKQSAPAVASNDTPTIPNSQEQPQQKQERALVTQDGLVREGNKEPPAKDSALRAKTAAKKSLANSKVKLAALEVERDADTGSPDIQGCHEYDYSLPASNSSSPAAAPAKKRATAKKQAVKKPAPKSKTNAREAKPAAGGRPKDAKSAPSPPVHQSPEAFAGENHNEDTVYGEEPSIVTQIPDEADTLPQMRHQKLDSGKSASEYQKKQDVVLISSDRTSSFSESDNGDDEDFEYSRKITPKNARRRKRAVAAESQADKAGKGKAGTGPAALPNARRQDAEDERGHLDAAERPEIQPEQPSKKTKTRPHQPSKKPKTQPAKPHKKTAVEKTQAIVTRNKPKLESTEEMKSSLEKPKKKSPTSERAAAANRISKDKEQTKQETVESSNADRARRDKANKPFQTSDPGRETNISCRKPNIVAFGPGGPNNNGRSHKTTATTDSRAQGHQLGASNRKAPAVKKSQLAKSVQKAHKIQSNTAFEVGDSPAFDFIGLAEGGLSRAARAGQPALAGYAPDNASVSKADTKATVPQFDSEMKTLKFEVERGDASGQVFTGDAEKADMVVEDDVNVVTDPQGYQNHEVANSFEENGEGEILKPLAQDIEHLHRHEQRSVLGEVDANDQILSKDAPVAITCLTKRKLPDMMTVEERSPIQPALASKIGSQSENFSTLGMNSATLEGRGRPSKRPRYNFAHPQRANQDAESTSTLVGGPDSLAQRRDRNNADDVFGPGKQGKPTWSSAFVQRLISNESADRGPDHVGLVAPASFDARAAPQQHPVAIDGPTTGQYVAPGVALRPRGSQKLDDVGKRMLAALGPEKAQVPSPFLPSDEHRKNLRSGDTRKIPWASDEFGQNEAEDLDEGTRVWKKATEPYADSVGETMHKIVNILLRGLKANEAAIDDVIEDYRKDGQRVVEKIADKHNKERVLIGQQQEQCRLRYVQIYGEARHVAETLVGKLNSVEIDKMLLHVGKDATTNRMKQLQQTITDA